MCVCVFVRVCVCVVCTFNIYSGTPNERPPPEGDKSALKRALDCVEGVIYTDYSWGLMSTATSYAVTAD